MKAIEQVISSSRKTHCKLHKYKIGQQKGWQSQAGRLCLHILPKPFIWQLMPDVEGKRLDQQVHPKPQLLHGHFTKTQHTSLSLLEIC